MSGMSIKASINSLKDFWCITFGIPGAENNAAVRGVVFYLLDALLQLVNTLSRIILVTVSILCSKVPPLEPIDWPKVSLAAVSQPSLFQELLRPIPIPNLHTLFREQLRVGGSVDKPEQFFEDPTHKRSFGCE